MWILAALVNHSEFYTLVLKHFSDRDVSLQEETGKVNQEFFLWE